ncbi:MAG: radical SAM protein [bacterium]
MNILLTSECNRRCSYCFAAERISYDADGATPHQAPRFMSRESFGACLELAQRSKQRTIGVLGGEPSLHPDFVRLLEDAWDKGLRTKIFTNGCWPKKHLEAVVKRAPEAGRLLRLVVNLNHPLETPMRERQAQHQFLQALGTHCALSFNIHSAALDPLFLVEVVRSYHTRRDIRLGVAQPLAEAGNSHIDVDDYRKMVPALMRLMEACDRSDIQMGFDCGFTLCMFTAEELGRLRLAGARFKSDCGPVVDVGTDLSVWACFPLSTLSSGVSLTDFENLRELVQYFRKRFDRLYRTGALRECVDCKHRRRKHCSGGCAAHVYRRYNP